MKSTVEKRESKTPLIERLRIKKGNRPKMYFRFMMIISIAVLILSLLLGVKELELVAILLSSVWFIYAIVIFITTFLFSPGLRIKVTRTDGIFMVKYELSDKVRKRDH